ncbi:amidohydrolase/deacetylase family metallohydrolase [Rhodovibrio salinarum]|uniref:Amidohydrolase/deacetylase family metallohydrolase n=1 Tax=Rhodovibrio salinarum TaxID=1087 RepID=A0A934QHG7_9PROT|nr:amidohydrolase/deacetylase family metallohydrolase [Rhodovibrio salinarum]MBK1696600.1 amidohydrolase/deacetylase family metallohydrolase [Rhodovibrio salinarum]
MAEQLILKNARVVDPSQKIDRVADIAFEDGRVVGLGSDIPANKNADIRDVTGKIVTPGLIDLHTHVYWGGTSLGIDADDYARLSAVTTSVDTGSAGAGNFPGFRKHVIDQAQARILVYLHVSFAGIFGFTPSLMVGESHDLRLVSAKEAARVIEANRDVIVGIKVRIGRHASGPAGIQPLDVALELAEETGLHIMAHIDEPPPTYEAVVSRLRAGDVLTHCFRPFPNAPVTGTGEIKPEVLKARERGVHFDIGHGMGSFSWKTARAMLERGFRPDTISSDVHAFCVEGPAFDQVTTLSKFLALGLPLDDVVAASTSTPAAILGRPELGTLRPGALGDASVLSLRETPVDLVDVEGATVRAEESLRAEGAVIGGQWVAPFEPHELPAGARPAHLAAHRG